MDAVVGFVETIVNMGAFVMMPAILFIMGLVFGMKVKDALRAGIVVGIGFKGMIQRYLSDFELDFRHDDPFSSKASRALGAEPERC